MEIRPRKNAAGFESQLKGMQSRYVCRRSAVSSCGVFHASMVCKWGTLAATTIEVSANCMRHLLMNPFPLAPVLSAKGSHTSSFHPCTHVASSQLDLPSTASVLLPGKPAASTLPYMRTFVHHRSLNTTGRNSQGAVALH